MSPTFFYAKVWICNKRPYFVYNAAFIAVSLTKSFILLAGKFPFTNLLALIVISSIASSESSLWSPVDKVVLELNQ